jgi:hypothetical protein
MPVTDPTDLDAVFGRLKSLFNAGDYDGMRPFLDSGITWKMLHHAGSVTGDGKVIQWLHDNKDPKKPQFNDTSKDRSPNPDGSMEIHGKADWVGDSVRLPVTTEKIEYHFSFVQNAADRWLLKNAFGIVLP